MNKLNTNNHQLNFKISPLIPFDNNLYKKFFILLTQLENPPPHLMMIFDEKIFASEVHQIRLNQPIHKLLDFIIKHKKATIWIEVKPPKSNIHNIPKILEESVVKIGQLDNNKTCLSPIKLAIETIYHINTQHINYIFELIPLLESHQLIQQIYQTNINQTSFDLPIYNKENIKQRIQNLKKQNKQD